MSGLNGPFLEARDNDEHGEALFDPIAFFGACDWCYRKPMRAMDQFCSDQCRALAVVCGEVEDDPGLAEWAE